MAKLLLVFLLMSSSLLVSTQAWMDVKDRLLGRVIHLETLLQQGRWLWQNDNKDDDWSRYLFVDQIAERDTYYQPRVQFETTACADYLCLEPLSLRNYFLASGYPANAQKKTVKLQYSTYPAGDIRFYWKFLCVDMTLEKCKAVPIRFESDGYLMVADDHGSSGGYSGGHYDATLGTDENKAYFRILAPNPTDGYKEVYRITNYGTTEQLVKYTVKMGMSQTHETSQSITSTVSAEVGGAFKAFSAGVSSSIESSWSTTDSSTFEVSKTVEHDLTLKGRTTVILRQLIGNYAGEFEVADDIFDIKEIPLDGGPARKRIMRIPPGSRDNKKHREGFSTCISYCRSKRALTKDQ